MGAGFLARIAFRAFGFKITFKQILIFFMAAVIAVCLWFAYDAVRDHFQSIEDDKAQIEQLGKDKSKLEDQKKDLIQLNADNAKTNQVADEQKASAVVIANDEQVKTTTRAKRYTEIRNEIDKAAEHQLDPAISNSLDGLW